MLEIRRPGPPTWIEIERLAMSVPRAVRGTIWQYCRYRAHETPPYLHTSLPVPKIAQYHTHPASAQDCTSV
eukprot:1576209-Rhodomonas_salina.1